MKRSHSVSDLKPIGHYYDIVDRYRPLYGKNYYIAPTDDLFFYRSYYATKYYPWRYFRVSRLEGINTYFSYAKQVPYYDTSPLYYRRNYFNYHEYPYRYWFTPSYTEGDFYYTPYKVFNPPYHYYFY